MNATQAVSADHPKCDECDAPASHSYTWEWGQSGFVCPTHQALKAQQAVNLSRACSFGVVSSTATAPLQREERVRMRAETLVAQEELAEAKTRGLEMYRQNQQLTQQVQSLKVQLRECESLRTDAVAAAEPMRKEIERLRIELAEATDEIGRLKVLVEIPPPAGTLPAADQPSTVGG